MGVKGQGAWRPGCFWLRKLCLPLEGQRGTLLPQPPRLCWLTGPSHRRCPDEAGGDSRGRGGPSPKPSRWQGSHRSISAQRAPGRGQRRPLSQLPPGQGENEKSQEKLPPPHGLRRRPRSLTAHCHRGCKKGGGQTESWGCGCEWAADGGRGGAALGSWNHSSTNSFIHSRFIHSTTQQA